MLNILRAASIGSRRHFILPIFEQLVISTGNFLFLWNSKHFASVEAQSCIASIYTLAIAFFPFYFALVVQPLRNLFYMRSLSIATTRHIFLLLISFVSIFSVFTIYRYFPQLSNSTSIAIAALFPILFYILDFLRRLILLCGGSLKVLLLTSLIVAILRSSSPFFTDYVLFLVVNISISFIVCLLLFLHISSYKIYPASPIKSITFFHLLSSLYKYFPLALLSFCIGSLPMIISARLSPDLFVFVTRVRALFSFLNPIFEYLDGSIFLQRSSSLSGDREKSKWFAHLLLISGCLFSALFSAGYYFLSDFRVFISGLTSPPGYLLHLSVAVFLLAFSSIIAYVVRVYIAMFRRSQMLRAEILIGLSALLPLVILVYPVNLFAVISLFFLIPSLQLIAAVILSERTAEAS